MKIKLIIFFLFLQNILFSQTNTEYKTHLFLGNWKMKTNSGDVLEKWTITNGEVTGSGVKLPENITTEYLKLKIIDDKLFYCATVPNQNEGKEICFELKSYIDSVRTFIFENPNHDFPKKIVYNFSYWKTLLVTIAGDETSETMEFKRDYLLGESFELRGKFIKEPFENKIGKVIEGVYDYFFMIQGIKYFIKFNDCPVSKEEILSNLEKDVSAVISFKDGLWDADDNTYQSRIGTYVSIIKIR